MNKHYSLNPEYVPEENSKSGSDFDLRIKLLSGTNNASFVRIAYRSLLSEGWTHEEIVKASRDCFNERYGLGDEVNDVRKVTRRFVNGFPQFNEWVFGLLKSTVP